MNNESKELDQNVFKGEQDISRLEKELSKVSGAVGACRRIIKQLESQRGSISAVKVAHYRQRLEELDPKMNQLADALDRARRSRS